MKIIEVSKTDLSSPFEFNGPCVDISREKTICVQAIYLELNKPIRTLSDDAIACLQQYKWPGNLNELRNIIDWLLIMAPNNEQGIITSEMLPPEINFTSNEVNFGSMNDFLSFNLKEAREKFEKEYLSAQIDRFSGNISRTASFIKMERSALHRKLKTLEIEK